MSGLCVLIKNILYWLSCRSRSRSRSYSPSYSRRHSRGYSDDGRRSKSKAPKIEYITEFGGHPCRGESKVGVSPPSSPLHAEDASNRSEHWTFNSSKIDLTIFFCCSLTPILLTGINLCAFKKWGLGFQHNWQVGSGRKFKFEAELSSEMDFFEIAHLNVYSSLVHSPAGHQQPVYLRPCMLILLRVHYLIKKRMWKW